MVANIGQDAELRKMQNGVSVCNLSLATSDEWKDQNGQKQQRTEWHRAVIFGRLAEVTSQYLKKGAEVYIEGRLQTRKWKDQSGHDVYTTEIIVDQRGQLLLLGGSRSQNIMGHVPNGEEQLRQGNTTPQSGPQAYLPQQQHQQTYQHQYKYAK